MCDYSLHSIQTRLAVEGGDLLTSEDYTGDFNEVESLGRTDSALGLAGMLVGKRCLGRAGRSWQLCGGRRTVSSREDAGRAKCRQMVSFAATPSHDWENLSCPRPSTRILHISVTVFIRISRISFCIRAKS
jgi:hypothetical protein